MNDNDILILWKTGLNKNQVARRYMQVYNQRIKVVRLDMKHRKERFMTYYEALNKVERIILEEVKNEMSREI